MDWYIWATLGVLAIVFEMISPTFFALFIGIGFLCSSAIAFFLPNALIPQIIFALIGMFIGLWVFKRRKIGDSPICKIGQTDEFVGTKGKVVKEADENSRAEALFDEPIFGRTQWPIVLNDNENIAINDYIEVVTIYSNHITVKKISN